MRKLLLIPILCALSYSIFGQSRAALKLAPSLSFNRVSATSDTLQFSSQGAAGRFIFGPMLEFPLGSSNGNFITGLLYAPKRVGIKVRGQEGSVSYREIYKLQYLQVPGIVSLYTDEISLDTRLYFNAGIVLEFKISQKLNQPDQIFISHFKNLNWSSVLGMGVEFAQGTSTVIAIGLGYHRSLNSVVSEHLRVDGELLIKPDVLSLDFTVWF